MCKSLVTIIFGLYLIGCTSPSSSRPPEDPAAQQFRNQHMELYRTMDMMPQPQPIIILKPSKT